MKNPGAIEMLTKSGPVQLRLVHATDGAIRVPLARWKKVPVEMSWGGSAVRKKLRRERSEETVN